MANRAYVVRVGDTEYDVDAPDEATAWQWAYTTHMQRTSGVRPTPTPTPTPTPAPAPRPPSGARGRAEEANTYLENLQLRAARALLSPGAPPMLGGLGVLSLGDLVLRERSRSGRTQADFARNEGALDMLGQQLEAGLSDLSGGLYRQASTFVPDSTAREVLRARAAANEAVSNAEIAGDITGEDVFADPLRNALPFITNQAIRSLPTLAAALVPGAGTAVVATATAGQVAQDRAAANNLENAGFVEGLIALPVGAVSAVLNRFGLDSILGTAGKTAAMRTLQAAAAEGSTEGIQSTIEYLGSRVGTERGVDAREAFESAMLGALAGTGLGGGLRGGYEAGAAGARAISNARIARTPEFQQTFEAEQARLYDAEVAEMAAANPDMDADAVTAAVEANQRQRNQTARQNALATVRAQRTAAAQQAEVGELSDTDPDVVQAFRSIMANETGALMRVSPDLTQDEAVEAVNEYAPQLLNLAKQQVAAARGGAGAGTTGAATPGPRADDAGLAGPVGGGAVAGVPSVGGTELPGAGVAPAGDIVGGRVGQSVAGLPISDVGAGAQPRALAPVTPKQIKATVPIIEQAFDANSIDFEDAYGVKKLNAEQKKQAARIVIESPEVDPYDAIGSVLERGQRLRGEKLPMGKRPGTQRTVTTINGVPTVTEGSMPPMPPMPPMPAPTVQPTVEEGAVPPTGSEAAVAPTTAVEEELAARDQEVSAEMLVPEAQTEPTVAETATVEAVAPPAEFTPQQIAENLQGFAGEAARAGNFDVPMFLEGTRDIQLGLEPIPDQKVLDETGPEGLKSYKAGRQWAQDSVAKAAQPAAAPTQAPRPENQRAPSPQNPGAIQQIPGKRTLKDYRLQGWNAAESGWSIDDDPYLATSSASDTWRAGFRSNNRVAKATPAAPARAPKKAKAVGTKGAKAKQVKAAITKKPGKTAAEKVLNMAQAEFDLTPKQDIVEQVTPYDPEYETIRAKPGINATRMAKMLGPQLYGDPTNMGQVCIKEVLQNSFDATRTALREGQVERGKIDIAVSNDGRTLTVKDNGIGMTPELLGGKFLEIAGTAKEGDKNAGGFGIAKMLFLYANKNIRVVTARDGRIAEMDVTGEQLFAALDNPEQAPYITIREFEPVDDVAFPDGHGTIIQLTIPEEAGEYKIKELPRWLDNIPSLGLSPLFSDIDVTFKGYTYFEPETVEIGSNFPVQDYTQFIGVKFPWGVAKVYVTRNQTDQKYGENMHILSNGLWQFSTKVQKDPAAMFGEPVPYRFYVDIVPSVKPDEPGYPFNFNRQNFTDDAKAAFGKVKGYIDAIYAYKSLAGQATSFGNIQYFQPNGQLGPVIDLTPDIPVQDTAFTKITEGDQITVDENGALLVNGQPMAELTPDQLKTGIPSDDELIISPDLIDPNAVMVHDNADVVIKSTDERIPIPDFMRQRFGQRFDDFLRYNGETFLTLRNEVARIMGYNALRSEAVGVSMDPEYRGVSIRLPFSGSFINPLVPKYADGLRAGYGIFGTMIHELAHHRVRSHNHKFPAEMQDILLNLEADEQFDYEWFKTAFATTVANEYADIVQLGVELFNGANPDIKVEYRGNRFTEGSGEQVPEGTGDGGAGDVRGPSGAGSAGESLLGPSFERTRGAGAGRDAERGAEGSAEPPTAAQVDAAVSVKLTKAQIRRAEEAAGIRQKNLSAMQKRIVQSRTPTETMSLVGKLMLIAKNPDKDVNVLTSLYNMIQPGVLSMVLGFQQTIDVVRLGTRAGMANPARINDMIQDEYVPYVNRLLQRASRLSEKWGDFVADAPEGADAMAELMIFSNMVDADPSRAPNPVAYLAIDPKFQDLTARYAVETNPKKKSNLKGQLTERRGEITRLYFGGATQDPNGNPMVVKGWKDVPPKGKEIFREARDHYRKDFEEHYRLLVQRIDDGGFEGETAARLKKSVDDMFAEAMQRAIYFPLKRFGEHWVSIGKGASREFHMFEGFLEREAFLAQRKLSGDTRPVSVGFGRDSLRSLRGEVSDVSEALKGILDIIDKGGATDPELLKDSVFQMYLSSLPEADMRRNFIHRQFTTGFSTDALRTFAVTAVASANQLGRLAYSGKLQNLIDQSYAETEFNPSKPRLDAITREMERRVKLTLSGDPEGAAARFADGVAKGTFLFLLSSVKSAFMNLTQLHLTGFPVLTAEFGEAATTAMAARYTGQLLTGRRIAYAVRDENGDVKPHSPRFTAEDSPYIRGLRETDPDRYAELQKAWLHAEEREVTQSTFTSAQNIYESGMEPSGTLSFTQAVRAGNTSEAVKRATENTIDGMGALFHHAERIGREIMYMSAFELAYDRGLKEGKTPEQAGEEARALAVKLTNEGMFDFSNWNKSRYSKAPVGRVALQMRAYSFQMSSLLARSAYNLIMAPPTKEGKLAAARVFMGVGAMTTLYAGVRASQFAILGMLAYGIYEFVMGLVPDDVDEEEEIETGVLSTETFDREFRKYADEQGRELSMKDMDYYIRTVWIPETFAGGIQDVFGLSDENTAKLALAADIGLPSLFGVDISNSIALTSLWHPVDTRADTPEARFYEGLGRTLLGPSGAFPTAAFKVWDEINKGNVGRAIEAGMPAFLRGYVKSERLQEEGLRIGKNNDIVLRDPSFYDTYTLMMQSMGFAEAVSSREMQLSIAATDIERAVEQEKTDLLDRRYRATLASRENPTDETIRALREVNRDIRIYNLNYPSNAITADTLRRSFQQKRREAVERSGGMGYNPRIPVRLPLVEERREERLREMAREAEQE